MSARELISDEMAISRTSPRTARRTMGRSKTSQLQIARIAQYIAEQGHASAAQVSALLELDPGTISRYLRHMCDEGLIHLAQRHCTEPGRQHPALYGFGDLHAVVDGWAELPPQVRKSVSWPCGMASRDPLVAALFGPACNPEVLKSHFEQPAAVAA